ncbi:hypothetical protein CC86DRAFT_443925 [Ophiobolus disseminans]|uniref:Lincomycin-condensing protein lmbA n=1 Tax=Ophiobolus disseminans TaxID=1469910 RepID=A0A6A7AAT6_9PLEO|nr:hypothetical protein CC86DRAFT_443925 [Ophiobolus disseminans]
MSLSKLQSLFPCFTCTEPADLTFPDEKASLLAAAANDDNDTENNNPRAAALIAQDVVSTLLTTSLRGPALQMHLDALVGTYGWRENLAKWILEKLSRALEWGHDDLGPAMRAAYERATEVALGVKGFVREHPVFCTVVALGVLALMAPWVLEVLGFVEMGIEEGSFAAWWQSTYAGLVPKGSLFSFFQRLGMTWHWV